MNKKYIRVSIVIPVYNEERYLRRCLEAIAHQTSVPYEVIVVDNNSTDGSMAVVGEFPFVKVITQKKQGIVYARNTGFDAARGDIIGRIDADSVLPADWVAYIQNFYDDSSNMTKAWTGGCYFYNVRVGRFQGWLQGQVAFRWNRHLLGHYILFGSNMALPRSVWQKVRQLVCDQTDVHEDLDLAIHVHRTGYAITYDEGVKVGVRMSSVILSSAAHRQNMMLWPNTLRKHHLKAWVLGWCGAMVLWLGAPVQYVADWIARVTGSPPVAQK